jgi:hypothetical protein
VVFHADPKSRSQTFNESNALAALLTAVKTPAGFPGLSWVLSGAFLFVLGTIAYFYEVRLTPPTPEGVASLIVVAQIYLLTMVAAVAIVLLGLWREYRRKVVAIKLAGMAPISPPWMIPYVLSLKKYRSYFFTSAIGYGLFYSILTSMIVFQPTVDFASAYGAAIPSAEIAPIRGAPLFSPVVTVYLTDHVGMLLIPLTILLALAISMLVGLNFALASFALGSRAKGTGSGWIGGIGAAVGLFTGCPTCAGLFFANVLGGAGAVSFATLLSYYQPVFILLSIPVLLVTPYFFSRSLARVYRDGCVIVKSAPAGA